MTTQTKKLLIEISSNEYYRCVEEAEESIPTDLEEAIANGIDVNELTNGEGIMKMFPEAKINFVEEWDSYDNGDICHPYVETFVNVDFGYGEVLGFSLEWWNRKWGE